MLHLWLSIGLPASINGNLRPKIGLLKGFPLSPIGISFPGSAQRKNQSFRAKYVETSLEGIEQSQGCVW